MLTILSMPRAFTGIYKTIQENAIQSWLCITPKPEIILFGDDEGTAEVAKKYSIHHIPDVKQLEIGTPVISDLFVKAADKSSKEYMCFVNSDVILDPNLFNVAKKAQEKARNSLLISRRWDLDWNEEINFKDKSWFRKIKTAANNNGNLFSHEAIDLFIFPKDLYRCMPPLTIGFPGSKYDNWMIYHAKSQGLTVFDLTESITIVHQNHPARPYSELSPEKAAEHMRSLKLIGGYGYCYDVHDADYKITEKMEIVKNHLPANYILRQLKRILQRIIDPIRFRLPWINRPR
jgi:hypothetical protein